MPGGAAILLIITRAHVEKVLQVDWATLLFFAGLFVVVDIIEESGLVTLLAKNIAWNYRERTMGDISFCYLDVCYC